ncbi:WXG100 family type VII secretion target [Paractinoplanes globisporus]|uniref:WXG100 family type VII secretion target n=1 Tax=Paractinoplanes globisporus TaxID=113565 RepID=A0ABW6WE29_9ACTN|nr:hypothetical protein [Actinoplanes globisporus]
MTNPLVAPTVDSPVSPWAGIWLADDVETILDGVKSRSWVEVSIGGTSAGLDVLAFVTDPIGSLLQYGIAWMIEHVRPLSEALDWLAGNPDEITAQSQTWRNIGAAMRDNCDDLIRAVRWDTTEWEGEAGDAYRAWSTNQQNTIKALAQAADAMAVMTEAAATLIAGVRQMVRDAIAVLVSRLVDYALEELFSLGTATGLVLNQVTTLCAAWSDRISHWLRDLLSSLRNLSALGDRLKEALESIKNLLRRLSSGPAETVLSRVKKRGAGNAQFFKLETVRSVAEKYGIDLAGLTISLADAAKRGRCACTYPDGSIVLFSPAFRSEEDLARTLVHEKFHSDELAAGSEFPRTEADRDKWEDRAYAYEDEWWNNQPVRPEPRDN